MCDMRRSRGLTRVSDPPVGVAPTRSSPTRRWGPPSWARVTRVRPRVSLQAAGRRAEWEAAFRPCFGPRYMGLGRSVRPVLGRSRGGREDLLPPLERRL